MNRTFRKTKRPEEIQAQQKAELVEVVQHSVVEVAVEEPQPSIEDSAAKALSKTSESVSSFRMRQYPTAELKVIQGQIKHMQVWLSKITMTVSQSNL